MSGFAQHFDASDWADVIADAIKMACDPLAERIRDLEKQIKVLSAAPKSAIEWSGVYVADRLYTAGQCVTRNGSLWLCVDTTDGRPGQSSGWKLIVKGDRERRDE